MSNFDKMVQQAQRMQAELEKAQDEVGDLEVTHACNGVEVVARGDFSIKSISISDELIQDQDREMLQDVVQTAVNGALQKARGEVEGRMENITGGLRIPGLF